MLTHHLHGLDPTLQMVQGSLIATHIGEVTLEMRSYMETKVMTNKSEKEKRKQDLLGSNLIYLPRLSQVATHKDLHPVWKELMRAPKFQHVTTFQRALDDTARRFSVRVSIVTTPGMPKLTLNLGFCLDKAINLARASTSLGLANTDLMTERC